MNKIQVGKRVGEIFETKDYSIFKFRDDNRIVNVNHVKKLSQRMKEKGWLSSSVVTINGSGDVIDGQHRVKAAMSVNCPVRYKVTKGAGIDEMTAMNTLQRNWSPFDHVHKFVVRGNENYIKFDNFTKDYPMFKYTEIAMFLNNNKSTFVRSLIKIFSTKPEFVFEEFIHKLKLRPTMLVPCGTLEQYVGVIENIYNFKRSDKISLRY